MTESCAQIWPVLTVEDFQLTDHATERVLPFIEDETGEGVYGYGHWDKASFAAAVNGYDLQRRPADSGNAGQYRPDDVRHVWAVVADPETKRFSWPGVTADHPNSFPVTLIQRTPGFRQLSGRTPL